MKKIFALSFCLLLILNFSKVDTEASLPKGFNVVSKTEITKSTIAYELVHKVTNCHYIYVDGDRDGGLTQMFVQSGQISVPYCKNK